MLGLAICFLVQPFMKNICTNVITCITIIIFQAKLCWLEGHDNAVPNVPDEGKHSEAVVAASKVLFALDGVYMGGEEEE